MSVGYVEQEHHDEPLVRIKVFGIGGGGNNAVGKMHDFKNKYSNLVEMYAANTDLQVLRALNEQGLNKKIQLGKELTAGRGAGTKPEIGAKAAEENENEILEYMQGAEIIFLATGLGGGTGTGATPIFAKLAQKLDPKPIVIAVVTTPFDFEGMERKEIAQKGIAELAHEVNALIVIANDNIRDTLGRNFKITKGFAEADRILSDAIESITEMIVETGFINMDLSDVQTVMQFKGRAIIGSASAVGENRAIVATETAVSSPLLENIDIRQAKGILYMISFREDDLDTGEIEIVSKTLKQLANEQVISKMGLYINNHSLEEGEIRVSVFATGIGLEGLNDPEQDDDEPQDDGDHFGVPNTVPNILRM